MLSSQYGIARRAHTLHLRDDQPRAVVSGATRETRRVTAMRRPLRRAHLLGMMHVSTHLRERMELSQNVE